ncbi:MAG: LemA family protein [Promethearchaeota archaeon]
MKTGTKQIALCAVLTIAIVGGSFGAIYILSYNNIVASREQARVKWNAIWVEYERKIELIPQLIEVVQNHTSFLNDLLTQIVQLRTQWLTLNGTFSEQANVSSQLNQLFNSLFLAVAEDYPDVAGDTLYQNLFDEITGTENRITQAKLDYNDAVANFNTLILMFPGNIIAASAGFTPLNYYEGTTPT